MPWARLDDKFWVNTKVRSVSNDALALYTTAISYCAAELTDGLVDEAMTRALCAMRRITNQNNVVAELVTAGLWEAQPDGYRIHDFLAYNKSREQVLAERQDSAKRQNKWLAEHKGANDQAEAETNGVTNTVSVPVTKNVPYPIPYPDPVPVPDPMPEGEPEDAVRKRPPQRASAPVERSPLEAYYFAQTNKSRLTPAQSEDLRLIENVQGLVVGKEAVHWFATNPGMRWKALLTRAANIAAERAGRAPPVRPAMGGNSKGQTMSDKFAVVDEAVDKVFSGGSYFGTEPHERDSQGSAGGLPQGTG